MCYGEKLTECSDEDEGINAYLNNSSYVCRNGKIYKRKKEIDSRQYCIFPEEGNVDPTQPDKCECFMCNLKHEKG